MKYVIDTSSILEGATNRRYELELFPTHWNNLSKIINEKIVVSTPLVLKELGKRMMICSNGLNPDKICFNLL